MRIIAGQWRGRALTAPPGQATRPTSDRAREAIFSMLTSRLGSFAELAALDVFAGTGALGLEALSRGAAFATFIEQDAAAARALRSNLAALGVAAAASASDVRMQPVASLGPGRPHHMVFLDPPYNSGLAAPALAHLHSQGWIAAGALISVETAAAEPIDTPFDCLVDRRFGKARIRLLRAP